MQTPDETLRARHRLVPRQRAGCSCRSCAGSASPRASCPATSSSSPPTGRSTARPGRCRLHRPARLGRGRTSPAPAGSASTRRRGCSPARATSRSRARPRTAGAAPIAGVHRGGAEVDFDVRQRGARASTRTRGSPRPTPTGSGRAIDALGRAVDDAPARAGDVRLTMGGEPTFVSIDDMEAPSGPSTADGPTKRGLAERPDRRAWPRRFAPGALLHHGQGKWYPGEPLPRWQIGVHWRADGVPVWSDRALLADPQPAGGDQPAPDAKAARRGARSPALGLARPTRLLAAYEDPMASGVARRRSTARATTLAGAGAATADRGRPGRLGRCPLRAGRPAGWATGGVARCAAAGCSCSPATRRGPAPAARRRLTWSAGPSSTRRRRSTDRALRRGARRARLRVPAAARGAATTRSTLVGVVEAAAAELRTAGRPRGLRAARRPAHRALDRHARPRRDRGQRPPARVVGRARRAHHRRCTTRPRRPASAPRSSRSTACTRGTGGGNHMTLGGATPADSPLLRRPDLLRSLITYWQHHPSLSYLFSGRFVGPTSQAPRVDEGARRRALRARDRVRRARPARGRGHAAPPWLVDRLLRNLLVDLTGNTHRAEFCIDKLFSPDSERGRLGLLELRAFEMPPHPRMALVQALLVRALVARFWDDPYRGAARALGHRAARPLPAAPRRSRPTSPTSLDDLARARLRVRRSPGSPRSSSSASRASARSHIDGVHVELRQAIEPWLVLGEESRQRAPPATSTRRSSACRCGSTASTRRGTPSPATAALVPLQPTGDAGDVRGRRPLPGLAAALGAASDDRRPLAARVRRRRPWNGRSLGGCTYHVVAPRRPCYDTLPGERQRGRGAPREPLRGASGTRPARSSVPHGRQGPRATIPCGPWTSGAPAAARPTRSP